MHPLLRVEPVLLYTVDRIDIMSLFSFGLELFLKVFVDIAENIHALILTIKIVLIFLIVLLQLFYLLLSLCCFGLLLPEFVLQPFDCSLVISTFSRSLLLSLFEGRGIFFSHLGFCFVKPFYFFFERKVFFDCRT